MVHLTDRFVKTLQPPTQRAQEIHYDNIIRGFGVRVTKGGAKGFILNYHISGRERRTTIGSYPAWSVAAAREQTARLRQGVEAGHDPLAEKAARDGERTFVDLWERYAVEVLPKKAKRGQVDERAMWGKHVLPALGRQRLSQVSYSDVEQLHRKISINTPVRANRVIASVGDAYSLVNRWGWCSDNPAKRIKRNPEEPRCRYLTLDEVKRLIEELDKHPQKTSASAIKFILLTGCRRGEALQST